MSGNATWPPEVAVALVEMAFVAVSTRVVQSISRSSGSGRVVDDGSRDLGGANVMITILNFVDFQITDCQNVDCQQGDQMIS
jgi:hypothetical protein